MRFNKFCEADNGLVGWLCGALPECAHPGSQLVPVAPGGQTPPECVTARLALGLAFRGMNFLLLPLHPETFSANIPGKFNDNFLKIAEAGWEDKKRDGGHSMNEPLIQWNLTSQSMTRWSFMKNKTLS